jgi:hypothetical protein
LPAAGRVDGQDVRKEAREKEKYYKSGIGREILRRIIPR